MKPRVGYTRGSVFKKLHQRLRQPSFFARVYLISQNLNKQSQSILDVACGIGNPMELINKDKKFFTIGTELFEPYLKVCKDKGTHDEYVLCDLRNLPFKEQSVDTILGMDIIEHVKKEDGVKALQDFERIAKKQIILTLPSRERNPTWDDPTNPFERHQATYSPHEFRKLGYKVTGFGIPPICGVDREERLIASLPRPLAKIFVIIRLLAWIVAAPLVYYFPYLSHQMICVKDLSKPRVNNKKSR